MAIGVFLSSPVVAEEDQDSDEIQMECPTYIPSEDQNNADILALYGVACFEEERYAWALTYYRASFELQPSHSLLGVMGRSLHELGLYEPALHYYEQFLDRQPPPSGADRIRQRIDELEAALEEESGTAALRSTPGGAEAFVVLENGEWYPLGTTPIDVRTSPRRYEFVFDADGYRPRHRRARIRTGSQREIDGDLISEESALDISQRNRRRAGLWTMTGSLVPAAAGATLLVLSGQESSTATTLEQGDFDDLSDYDQRRRDHLDQAATYRLWGTTTAAVGAVGLLTGAILFLSTPSPGNATTEGDAEESATIPEPVYSVEPLVGINHLGFRLRF